MLREKHGDVEVVNVDQQLVYLLSPQHQLEERVKHGLVPVSPHLVVLIYNKFEISF